ncbi:chaplin family protein [Streptomyces sp. NPDC001262]|uniref:chaplin family protein n=1 Tax=Streptomyces sp. NPDC001262 TaxID=3364552 RepID=UPI00367A1A83
MSIRNAAAVTALAAAAIGAGAAGAAADGAHAATCKDPGVVAGNIAQVAPRVSPNVGGNTISVVGILNSSTGNTLVNE